MEKIELPKEYIEIMKNDLGKDFESYLASFSKSATRGLRVNTNKIALKDYEKLTNLPISKLPFSVDGYLLNSDEKIGNTPEHLAGLIYLQEPSSMLPVVASDIVNDKRTLKVLDLCASPGGKTGQISTRVNEKSIIFSNEIIKSRAESLFSNVERLGFKNVIVLNEQPSNLTSFEGYFDYVFVDAPCSGEGMFRKNPETIFEWSKQNVLMCSDRQKEILDCAQKLVKANGKLIYSTCTFSRQEDEEIIEWFVNNFDFEIESVPDKVLNVTKSCDLNVKNGSMARKFLPYIADGEGQFFCVLKKKNIELDSKLYTKKHFRSIELVSRTNFEIFSDFVKNNMNTNFERNKIFEVGGNLYLVPQLFDSKIQTALDELKIITLGVKLGQIEKKIFKPNHSLFMTFGDKFKTKIELSDEELKKYLHGEEIIKSGLDDGFAVVTKNDFSLGGVKISSGKLKNLYPKGLRI